MPSIPHKDYLPDRDREPDPQEHDYEPEEEDPHGAPEEDYDDYPEREND